VGEPLGEVALVEVAGADPVPDEFLHRVFMIRGQSFTPASRTLWLPGGMPASASRASASVEEAVISAGWLK